MNTRYRSGKQEDNYGYCDFHVGQHVVCVDDFWQHRRPRIKYPVKGVVYTIREVYVGLSPTGMVPSVKLAEIVNEIGRYRVSEGLAYVEPGFTARRFRSLQKLTPEQFMQTDAPVEGREVVA